MSKKLLAFLIPSFFFLIIILIFFLNQRKINEKVENFLEWGKAQISQFSKKESEIEEIKKEISGLREEIIRMKNNTYLESEEIKSSESKIEKESEIEEEKWCQKSENQNPKREVIFNEICWMGDKDSSYNEWIELKNISKNDLDLTGWQLKNKDEKIKIVLEGKIKKDGFFILERGEDALPEIESDFVFKGAIKNENEALFLFDKDCNLEDEVFANPNWPAGDNLTKRTAERKKDFNWQTSQNPGGTPKAENSQGFVETKEEKQPKITLNYPFEVFGQKEFEVSLSVSDLESKTYDIKISIESDSQILSEIFDPSQNSWQSSNYYLKEYFTGSSFSGNFKLKIKTTNFIGDAKIFAKIRDSKSQKIVSQFEDRIKIKQEETPLIGEETPLASEETQTSSSTFCTKILISEIQIVPTEERFIELYNSCNSEINLTGWYIQRKTATGKDWTSLVSSTYFEGKILQPKSYFLITRSPRENSDIVKEDLTLTEDNVILIKNQNREIVDKVGWGNAQDSETAPAINPDSGKSIGRKWSDVLGSYVDNDNNQTDFSIQNPTPKAKNSVSQ
jgi:hypothetical protein